MDHLLPRVTLGRTEVEVAERGGRRLNCLRSLPLLSLREQLARRSTPSLDCLPGSAGNSTQSLAN
jgi:hypothetical protein